jgi:ABC-type branched-subunit amino acid transport system ATPase component
MEVKMFDVCGTKPMPLCTRACGVSWVMSSPPSRTGIPILMVEQNARQALEIADKGYVLVQGRNAHTGTGKELLADPEVRRSFLGG